MTGCPFSRIVTLLVTPVTLCCVILCSAGSGVAAEQVIAQEKAGGRPPMASEPSAQKAEEHGLPFFSQSPVVTRHAIRINGRDLDYTATAGYSPLYSQSGRTEANIFFVSYENDGQKDKAGWPVSFAFNGGPGASSAYLHLGALGPKRALLKDEGNNSAPPYQLEPNEFTWLSFTDLVFIDPVGTGYSRSGPNTDPKKFYGVKEGIREVGDFIQLYITKSRRWLSPKFIVGESYGATRAAGISSYLQEVYKMNVNGLVLISPLLDFQARIFQAGNSLPYCLYLPSYTAAARYHKKLQSELQSRELPELLGEVEAWIMEKYYPALFKGAALPEDERLELIEKMAYYTGISSTIIQEKNFRLDHLVFGKELLHSEHRLIGKLDSRFVSIDPYPESSEYKFDPSLFAAAVPFGAVMNDYSRNELNYQNDLPYMIHNEEVDRLWDWSSGVHGQMGYVNLLPDLRKAMSKNSRMKIFVAYGYYDLTTPYWATKYTINQISLDQAVQNNITASAYDVGHQIYVHLPSLKKLADDVSSFIRQALLDASP